LDVGFYPHSLKKGSVEKIQRKPLGQGRKKSDRLFKVKQTEDFMEKDMW
jgi:hypothetical protein